MDDTYEEDEGDSVSEQSCETRYAIEEVGGTRGFHDEVRDF